MTMQQLLRQGWENLVGLVFAVAGLFLLLVGFWVNYVLAGLRAANMSPPILVSDEAPPLAEEMPEEAPPTPPTMPIESLVLDESKLLPTEGIYIIDGQSLDATVNEIIRREQARIAAEKAAAEAKRKREEEARRQRLLEQKRKEEEAKRRKLEKQRAEAKRKEEARRKAEAAKQRQLQAQKKAEEEKRKRKAAQKQKAAAEKRRKAEAEAATKRKAEEARRKAAAQKKAAEAARKAKEARELDAKLAALGASAPSLDGGLQSAGSAYDQRDIEGYAALLDTAVSRYYRLPDNIPNNLEAKFVIKINSSGQVVDVVLQRSSGYPLFDREARNAIFAASPLPLPDNPALRADTIKQGIEFTFNP